MDSVSAVMITGHLPERRRFAFAAVRCFLRQTYPRRELVIINTGAALTVSRARVREVLLPPGSLTLGELRNIGLQHATGTHVIQWDDDDWHHPRRIEHQLEAARGRQASLLAHQVRYSFGSGRSVVASKPTRGIEGTILHLHRAGVKYPAMRRGEDTEFLKLHADVAILRKSPTLYLKLFHGSNTWGDDKLMRSARRGLYAREARFLERVLAVDYAGSEAASLPSPESR